MSDLSGGIREWWGEDDGRRKKRSNNSKVSTADIYFDASLPSIAKYRHALQPFAPEAMRPDAPKDTLPLIVMSLSVQTITRRIDGRVEYDWQGWCVFALSGP